MLTQVLDPKEILWLQKTISPEFSQGAPDPEDATRNLPGERVLAVAKKIKDKKLSAQNFPPLKVFTLTDPDTGILHTYSLSNRRLTAFRCAGISEVRTQPATLKEIYSSRWKMTSEDGGFTQPAITGSGDHFATPSKDSTLGKFKNSMESIGFVLENFCKTNEISGQEKETYVFDGLERNMRAKFNLS